jgi:hypothetical protein
MRHGDQVFTLTEFIEIAQKSVSLIMDSRLRGNDVSAARLSFPRRRII